MAAEIDPWDVELLEWAGVPEFEEDTMSDTKLIPNSPGFVGDLIYPNELSADVALELIYINLSPGATRAGLTLFATDIEGGKASETMGIELTKGDICRAPAPTSALSSFG